MKAFNKDRALRKLKFRQNRGKYIKYGSIVLSCLILVIGIIMFTFAKFESVSEWTLIEGTVTESSKDANIIAIYQGNTKVDSVPAKGSGWYFDRAECTNGATTVWNGANWSLDVKFTGKTKCSVYFVQGTNAVTYVNNLDKNANSLIADGTTDNNLRYVGSNPNNYVQFNNELWRIIGIMNNIQTGTGQTQSLLKIRRATHIGEYSWDTSASSINSGFGINQWGPSNGYEGADLMRELNTDYLGNTYIGIDGKWYSGGRNTKSNAAPTSTISNLAQDIIETIVWNLGSPSNNNGSFDSSWSTGVTASISYTRERANTNGKTCSSDNTDCTDTVDRTSTWTGKVALIYPSDYLYATAGGSTTNRATCLSTAMYSWSNVSDCYNNDWLYTNIKQWTLSPLADSSVARSSFLVDYTGIVGPFHVVYSRSVSPVVYLKSSTVITGGQGTQDNPYKLG